jgi:hypothetical protein
MNRRHFASQSPHAKGTNGDTCAELQAVQTRQSWMLMPHFGDLCSISLFFLALNVMIIQGESSKRARRLKRYNRQQATQSPRIALVTTSYYDKDTQIYNSFTDHFLSKACYASRHGWHGYDFYLDTFNRLPDDGLRRSLQRRSSRCSSWTSTIGSISQMMFS